MSETKATSETKKASLPSSDSASLLISPVKLDGTNYLAWARSCTLFIKSRGLQGYINGKKRKPDEDAAEFDQWDSENSLVMSWLINSMKPEISRSYMFLDTAAKIWESASETYSQRGNDVQVFEIRNKLRNLKQCDKTVSQYFAELSGLWQELDYYQDFQAECPKDATKFRKMVDKERVFDFLAGLNPEYDQIRGAILEKDPFPSVQLAHSMIQKEKNRRIVMLEAPSIDKAGLMVSSVEKAKPPTTLSNKEHLQCDYCGKPKHTKEMCWKLHGRPNQNRGKKNGSRMRGQAHMVEGIEASDTPGAGGLSNEAVMEELQNLRRLFSKLESSSTVGTSNHVQSGINSVISTVNPWIIDSGANRHMTGSSKEFATYSSGKKGDNVRIADGSFTPVSGTGSVSCTPNINLSSVLHVPHFSVNLLSVSSITKELQCKIEFFPDHCVFQDLQTGKRIGTGRLQNGLYVLDKNHETVAHQASLGNDVINREILQWHRRLGHPSFVVLEKLFPSLFRKTSLDSLFCEACELAKHTRCSYHLSKNKSSIPFAVIHSDVWGPTQTHSHKGYRWFVTFIDCCTRSTWIYLMKAKNEVFSCFQSFHKMVSTQFDAKVKILRSDNGLEYMDKNFGAYLESNGIIHQTSCAYTSEQNGVAERKNRHILEVARSLMFTMNLPKGYWGDAVMAAAYLINRMPLRVLDYKSPVEVLQGKNSYTVPPRVFGCVCYVHARNVGKLDPRALKCVFVGYSSTQKGYKCYHPPTRKYFVTMDVTFREYEPYFDVHQTPLQGEIESEEVMFDSRILDNVIQGENTNQVQVQQNQEEEDNVVQGENQERDVSVLGRLDRPDLKTYSRREKAILQPPMSSSSPECTSELPLTTSSPDDLDWPIAIRKSVRSCTKHPISNFVSYDSLSPSYRAFVLSVSSVSIPQDWREALQKMEWKEAMNEEMKALAKNETWELVKAPKEKRTVGCKWVFTVKHKSDGSIERYKARLVAKGFTQTYGVDYQETFAPVAKMNTIRILLSCAANLDWELQQFDVKNAFLHGDLQEEVYMDIPPGFEDEKTRGKVCRLKKALYGLKQSPRAWFERFSRAMTSFGYKQSNADHTLFIRHSRGMITLLIVYVDDIVVTGNDLEEIARLKKLLAQEFDIKDLGKLQYFLGIEVARSGKGIFISQMKYILDLLEETSMMGYKPAESPVDGNCKLQGGVGAKVDVGRYQRLVGRLIYLSHTRPDIAFAVSLVSQYMHDPRESHMQAVFRILKYLKSAPGKGLLFSKNGHLKIEAYTDADWAGCPDDRRSTTGYCTILGGNLVTWRSKKQSVVARSSAEAEYRAMAQGICELLWLRKLMEELQLSSMESLCLYCDNKAAISIAHNPVQHDRTKHIEIDRHFIKEKLADGSLHLSHVTSKGQLADIFTKGLYNKQFHNLLCKLGMCDIYAPT
eukprot:TRINITY_DN1235_c0_g1_i6.p1 TRINITY_DN1235_c0_g1~~TRINITY_DN1235_c0_g1_i6.p1  ORF type:complete len:1428 (+),score=264.56 TRINITY_DN1235_c0_g1_i6:585-4868(+)